MRKDKLSVIIPAYNEGKNLERIPKEVVEEVNELKLKGKKLEYEIIIVDDVSKDETKRIAKKLQHKNKNIKVITHKKNKGLGAAVQTGIKKAKGSLTVVLDADLTFHPKYIKKLIKAYEKGGADIVIGSPSLAKKDKKIPFYRLALSKSCNKLYSLLLWRNITAMSPIFKLYKTNLLKKLTLTSKGFAINAEIVAKAIIHYKAKIEEIPATLTVRRYGVSKINNLKEIKNHLFMYAKIIGWRLK